MIDAAALVIAGAFAGGLVNGLTGFGTGLVVLPIWLQALAPTLASPLAVVCSVVAQLQTLPAIWHAIDARRIAPFMVGGAAGVPLGTWLLPQVPASTFKLAVGVLLVVVCGGLLMLSNRPPVLRGGRWADGLVGLGGGVLGGLAGLSGPLPTLWASLRGWGKDERRAVFQAFNLGVLSLAMLAQADRGADDGRTGAACAAGAARHPARRLDRPAPVRSARRGALSPHRAGRAAAGRRVDDRLGLAQRGHARLTSPPPRPTTCAAASVSGRATARSTGSPADAIRSASIRHSARR